MKDSMIRMVSVDDAALTTELDKAGYRKMGVSVKFVRSFKEIEKILNQEPVDLVTVNLDAPVESPLDFVKHMKQSSKWQNIPVVCTSVQSGAQISRKALDAGADLFVERPLPRDYFIEKLKNLLDQKVRGGYRASLEALSADVIFDYKGKMRECSVGDISQSGMLLLTNLNLEQGLSLKLTLNLPDEGKKFELTGEVVRVVHENEINADEQSGIGIKFVHLNKAAQAWLDRYLRKSERDDKGLRYYL